MQFLINSQRHYEAASVCEWVRESVWAWVCGYKDVWSEFWILLPTLRQWEDERSNSPPLRAVCVYARSFMKGLVSTAAGRAPCFVPSSPGKLPHHHCVISWVNAAQFILFWMQLKRDVIVFQICCSSLITWYEHRSGEMNQYVALKWQLKSWQTVHLQTLIAHYVKVVNKRHIP